jgi:hypothetical protein
VINPHSQRYIVGITPYKKCRCLWIILTVTVFTACAPVGSPRDLIGTYELQTNFRTSKPRIELEVLSNGLFTEKIFLVSGQIECLSGKWHWEASSITFDRLLIPASVTPPAIMASRVSLLGERATKPGSWSIMPEIHWGKTVLSIFPDSVQFVLVHPGSK